MRIAIVGSSGSGKTTLARRIAERLDIAHVELDAVHHLADWQPNPDFLTDLAAELEQPDWVCDGNYGQTDELVRGRADIIVAFDLPRHQVMRQVVVRTIGRLVRREELWNGNRERLSSLFRWDPEHSIIRWSWVHHGRRREHMLESRRSGAWDHAEVVWVRSHADADSWLGTLG